MFRLIPGTTVRIPRFPIVKGRAKDAENYPESPMVYHLKEEPNGEFDFIPDDGKHQFPGGFIMFGPDTQPGDEIVIDSVERVEAQYASARRAEQQRQEGDQQQRAAMGG